MSTRMKMRWALVCCIWGLALGVTFWNGSHINAVAAARQNNEQIRREIDFQRQNRQKLDRVVASNDALFLPVESVDLGIVAVRSRLVALSAAFDLVDANIRPEITGITEDQVPFAASMRGSVNHAVDFLLALHNYSYLTVGRTTITTALDSGEIDLQIEFLLRYRMVKDIQAPDDAPRVTTQRTGTQIEAL